MFLLVFRGDAHVRGGHAVFPDFFCSELPTRDLKRLQPGAEQVSRAAGIDKGAKGHVAANAGKTIKIGEFHGCFRAARRWLTATFCAIRGIV